MNVAPTPENPQADPQREELVDKLIAQLTELGALRSGEVEAAIRAVPRHLFVPDVPLAQAYAAEDAPVVKRDEHGVVISSVSAVRVQAMMLEQAEVRPGMRVLEIGSGGYNAALIAELVGEGGQVTTIDIDRDVIDRARRLLSETGYERVTALVADGEEGEPGRAPYDRIIVTVGAWDIPPAWTNQLAEGGRIVVPLRVRGLTRSVAFERRGGRLVSREYELCGFVPMQGAGENRVRLVLLHDEDGAQVGLRLDDGQQVDVGGLREALRQPHVEVWSGVTIGGMEPFDNLDLWLATTLPDYALLTATPAARERGLVTSASPLGTSVLVDGDSFAYRRIRPTSPERTAFEFGARGHGPEAKAVAERLVEEIRAWDRAHRADRARYEVHPAGTPEDRLPAGRVIDKRHTRVTISWP
ncbi:methyltransferase, FxLD system [Streptomyces sp. B1866]|uniref:methyltransferase, FxLD system n=1 Tax=Streptomyces sp. B1866 TaxID=3075431 RepID=UPI0028927B91|nr:methyltransferase, FxLD system [Streptomyces sp. B1866]MDT3396326.1 methyltransferase, FxLD system [Streptomyces sp. B1866]